jgi:voltage-gated potassium channel
MIKIHKALQQNKFLYLFISLITFFIVDAFLKDHFFQYLLNIFFSLVIIFSLYTIAYSKKLLFLTAIIIGIATMLVKWSQELVLPNYTMTIAQLSFAVTFFSLITFTTLYYTLSHRIITINTLFGAVSCYLLMGLTWGYLYTLLYFLNFDAFNINLPNTPGQINEATPLMSYYSFVTLTTLGFGDILPLSEPAKAFSWMEAVFGQIYLTVLIAQLVGRYIAHQHLSRMDTSKNE